MLVLLTMVHANDQDEGSYSYGSYGSYNSYTPTTAPTPAPTSLFDLFDERGYTDTSDPQGSLKSLYSDVKAGDQTAVALAAVGFGLFLLTCCCCGLLLRKMHLKIQDLRQATNASLERDRRSRQKKEEKQQKKRAKKEQKQRRMSKAMIRARADQTTRTAV